MSTNHVDLPLIDLANYFHPQCAEDKEKVINQVRSACQQYGFFQVKNHGIPLASQKELITALDEFFALPREDKMKLSFLKNPCRRGYEASGDSLRVGDALPDSKESFYIGRDDPVIEPPGFYGPNVWPNLPEAQFRAPVSAYYDATSDLGRTIWEILLQGLGHSPATLNVFATRPIVQMKMLRYPPVSATKEGQFGVGPHTDFGGVTVLLQQAGKNGLEVWVDEFQAWLPVPAVEDIYIINCGDMIQKWSKGAYRSAKHRVVYTGDTPRFSCATFWHGDCAASNPLDPNDPNKDSVGQLLLRRFGSQFSLSKQVMAKAA